MQWSASTFRIRKPFVHGTRGGSSGTSARQMSDANATNFGSPACHPGNFAWTGRNEARGCLQSFLREDTEPCQRVQEGKQPRMGNGEHLPAVVGHLGLAGRIENGCRACARTVILTSEYSVPRSQRCWQLGIPRPLDRLLFVQADVMTGRSHYHHWKASFSCISPNYTGAFDSPLPPPYITFE